MEVIVIVNERKQSLIQIIILFKKYTIHTKRCGIYNYKNIYLRFRDEDLFLFFWFGDAYFAANWSKNVFICASLFLFLSIIALSNPPASSSSLASPFLDCFKSFCLSDSASILAACSASLAHWKK